MGTRCGAKSGSNQLPASQAVTTAAGERVAIEGVEVDTFDGLLMNYVRRKEVHVVVRGLRAFTDFEYEFQMALMNRKLRGTVETVFMMPHERYTYISSRLIKEVASLGAPVTGLVPPVVEARLSEKFVKSVRK